MYRYRKKYIEINKINKYNILVVSHSQFSDLEFTMSEGKEFHSLGQFERLSLIKPGVLLVFVEIEAICWDHCNLLFTVTPRYEIDST